MGLFSAFLKWLRTNPTPPPPPTNRVPTGMPYRAPVPPTGPVSSTGGSRAAPPPLPKKVSGKLNLDAGQFTPLSEAEVKKRAAGLQWNWTTVNFDRRDQIPSSAEPRTALIDRALVAQGLLSPEQLVEIHEVGAKWAEIRPELAGVQTIANNAVAADGAARLALKEQKK